MIDDFFEFRDFKMQQAPSGQRINTDSCTFAALIGQQENPKRILDIGAGTGVVSLMLALRFPGAQIVAVEPEEEIAKIARGNMENSPWSSRLQVIICKAQDLDSHVCGKFDFVVCNPPYFHNSTLSSDRLRQVARHTTTLTPPHLFAAFSRLLAPCGTAWMSCPEKSKDEWIASGCHAGLNCHEYVQLQDHPTALPHVAIMGWSFGEQQFPKPQLISYRTAERGEQSPWMLEFRRQWYPSRYVKSN